MKKKHHTPAYEPPRALDLAALSARGQVTPAGQCQNGPAPYYSCVSGSRFPNFVCTTGAAPDTSACSAGTFHAQPTCDQGLSAATVCLSGSGQQW